MRVFDIIAEPLKTHHAYKDVADLREQVLSLMDVAVNPQTRKKVYLLAQSYMPAQQIHLLVNPQNRSLSPWYELSSETTGKHYTPEWVFNKSDLKRFISGNE